VDKTSLILDRFQLITDNLTSIRRVITSEFTGDKLEHSISYLKFSAWYHRINEVYGDFDPEKITC
jgi:hypothetical protein